ncbi:spore protease YyaC [Domibacillus sp. DTU_2020_1001157_1_SI_ALB_TIR_016]|uniref:spore protease YyaC n=1 Tax=Domibacillus sp. DTU_2020_1001157_1_SI_ALB_TIR_016 TaxID=3077789 RepID=UPI0028ED3C2A|nr:spore protease YyaC [Domibacillus sp. DTU_2020_1001157_1_SI_ALB_TIR_016]WNS78094.1 spore protease YyaC [Domibacillus sp. DTU_2020_1001157_1_SI_ALB_TIR_016]
MYPFKSRKSVCSGKDTALYPHIVTADEETEKMSEQIAQIIRSSPVDPVFLCIGSDRSTGDSFGPLVGTMLKEHQVPYQVFGTLSDPVHALNLKTVLKDIQKKKLHSFIFAIDACLGDSHQIGSIHFNEGPFRPGNAVHQALPPVGDYHLKAVVNHFDPFFPVHSLNHTRLDTVMKLSKKTTALLINAIERINRASEPASS